ncbi:hypothetical protein PWT90_10022 [Aphanocladium album]|nr:hypothetical protein PWT90_10022 [Aphanocladium album]
MKSAVIATVFTYLIGALAAHLGSKVATTAIQTSSIDAVLNGDVAVDAKDAELVHSLLNALAQRDEAPAATTTAATSTATDADAVTSPTSSASSAPSSDDTSEAPSPAEDKFVAILKEHGFSDASIKKMYNQNLINNVAGALMVLQMMLRKASPTVHSMLSLMLYSDVSKNPQEGDQQHSCYRQAAQILKRSADSSTEAFSKMLADMNMSEDEFFSVFADRVAELATKLNAQ